MREYVRVWSSSQHRKHLSCVAMLVVPVGITVQ